MVDESGTSTVWADLFETDKQALEEAFMAIETEGIGNFITKAHHEAKAAEPALLKALAQGKNSTHKPRSAGDDDAPVRQGA